MEMDQTMTSKMYLHLELAQTLLLGRALGQQLDVSEALAEQVKIMAQEDDSIIVYPYVLVYHLCVHILLLPLLVPDHRLVEMLNVRNNVPLKGPIGWSKYLQYTS